MISFNGKVQVKQTSTIQQKLLFSTLLVVFTLSACNPASSSSNVLNSSSSTSMSQADLPTPITDSFFFTTDYVGKSFIEDGVGIATLKSTVDGDTANFSVEGSSETIRLRFLGINTPESTAIIEPWGTSSSFFTKTKLESAVEIVLINDISVFRQKDGNGRYLGFIWYRPAIGANFRLLNLEIVEQAYSRNLLFLDSQITNYRPVFAEAGNAAQLTGRRVYGQLDPFYDYSNAIVEDITLRDIRENYSNYGVIEGGSAGLQLRLKAMVVGLIGDNMVLRDIENPYEDGTYAGMYAFAGYGSGLADRLSIGFVVQFYARATMFLGNIQLSDLKTRSFGDQRFIILERPTDANYSRDFSPLLLNSETINRDELSARDGYTVRIQIKIRTTIENTHFRIDDCANPTCSITVYGASLNNQTINLRFDASMFPRTYGPSNLLPQAFLEPNKTYWIVGQLIPYFDNFQIMMFNNTSGQNFIEAVQTN
jgi:endonuclease YncB( thermonuclease family)